MESLTMTGCICGDTDHVVFLKNQCLPSSLEQLSLWLWPDALFFHISRNIEKAQGWKENPCGFQGPWGSRVDEKNLHWNCKFKNSDFQFYNLKSELVALGMSIAFAGIPQQAATDGLSEAQSPHIDSSTLCIWIPGLNSIWLKFKTLTTSQWPPPESIWKRWIFFALNSFLSLPRLSWFFQHGRQV